MNLKLMTAQEIAVRYRKELKNVRIMRWLTLAVYIVLLWRLASKVNLTVAAVSVVIFLLAMRFLQNMQNQQFVMLQQVLNQDCDASKYTDIMECLLKDSAKDTTAITVCLARGQYFAGKFEEALETLDSVYIEKPSVGTALLYRNILFNCHLELGNLDACRGERQEVDALMNRVKPSERGLIQQQLMMMDAALAWTEDRYEEFFPMQMQILQEAKTPLMRVTAMYRLALGELVQSEDAAAREHLLQVVEHGGTLYMAAEAENLLEEYGLPENDA